jgi:tetratricopeptide (TPR) repeat protein
MEDIAALVATALIARGAEALASRGTKAVMALATLVRKRFARNAAEAEVVRGALEHPDDAARRVQLVDLLAEAMRQDPTFAEELRAHWRSAAADFRNELSGTVIGPSVQAGIVRDMHFYGVPSADLPSPRQLPPLPSYFTGRIDQLSQLDALLDLDSPGVAVLTGIGGVGKTALSVVWAHRVQGHFADGQLYADLGGYSGSEPVDPGEVLGMFLRAMGIAPQDVPATLAEQVSMYRSCTAIRSLLVILDDVVSPAQARVLRPASASSRMVVTSRGRLDGLVAEGALLIRVGPLDSADSVALLTHTLGASRVADARSAHALAEVCGGLPLALRVTAGRLTTRPRLSLERMVDELGEEKTRLPRLSIVDGASMLGVFDVSYRSLDPFAARLYRRLALHPGPEFGLGLAAAALGTCDDSAVVPADIVDQLVAASLLEEVGDDRFRFHDLLRLHAKRMLEEDESQVDRDQTLLAVLEWYWYAAARADQIVMPYRRRLPYQLRLLPEHLPILADRGAALAWLEQERVNLVAAGRSALAAGHHELAWQLSDVLWPLLLVSKHYRDRIEVDRRGVAAAEAWGNTWAQADMHKRLGRACTTAGEFAAAEQHLRTSVELYRKVDDARGAVDAQEGLAALYRDSGQEGRAVDLLRHTLAANRALNDDRCLGLTLITLGGLLTTLDRPAEALGLLLEAKDVFDRLADVDPYNRVRVTIGLASAYSRIGDLSRAEVAATEAARRMDELGSAFERAEALDLLGEIAQRRGDTDGARSHFHAAFDIFTALGSARAGRVRSRLVDLGVD